LTHTTSAPKPPEQRRNRTQPHLGEWVDLPGKLEAPVLPPYKRSFTISRAFWEAWRKDPITSQYRETDIAAAVDLATQWATLAHAEQRLRWTQLGLTPAGRRALRWRTQLEAKEQREAVEKAKQIRKLRVVGD